MAVRITNQATHRGTYRGIPATGKRVVFSAIWIFRIADGKIAEVWRWADDLGRVEQIGGKIVPSGDERESDRPPSKDGAV